VATSKYFAVKPGQDLAIVGSRTKRWSWVHINDLAEAYVAVAKVGRTVDGQVFNIASYQAPTYEELMTAYVPILS
jgi:nucleoside-diphosphate-sugar epimerase